VTSAPQRPFSSIFAALHEIIDLGPDIFEVAGSYFAHLSARCISGRPEFQQAADFVNGEPKFARATDEDEAAYLPRPVNPTPAGY
jgi:hypothetical protein